MCGITGYWSSDRRRQTSQRIIDAMTDRLTHRGPDDRGTWIDHKAGLCLGHRRLAILDLSADGAQPMLSASGRYAMVYNGEIYNFKALRNRLLNRDHPPNFRGRSDTEVLLATIDAVGLPQALEQANGMFAFALWDRRDRHLTLARDRLGIKPLYWGHTGQALIFGSELKSLRAHPDFSGPIDRQALADLLRLNSIPAPRSIYRDIHKLEPGTWRTFKSPDHMGQPRQYWSARRTATEGIHHPFCGTVEEAIDGLETRLMEAVKDRMVADVPLGAFLSGGVDSSTVVAMMQQLSRRPIKTFSIGFHDPSYNEANHARAVAEHLGTDHHEHYITSDDARAVIPSIPSLYDEPFADSSQIPTFLVSQLARRHVTVSLSGDGGDELFAGYNRHLWAPRIWQAMSPIPRLVRALVATALLVPSPARVHASYHRIESLLPSPIKMRIPAEKLQKLAGILSVHHFAQIYERLRSNWRDPASVVVGLTTDHPQWPAPLEGATAAQTMMFADLVSYLPDDILTKVDRASMGVALEARVPLLDHRLVAFAWRLPMALKIRDGQSKWILRQVLYRHVPSTLIERPKMGFGIPIDDWLRGPLRDWAEALLDPTRLRHEGFFHVDPIRQMWGDHLRGRANHQHRLWNILTFQAWLQNQ